MHQKYALRPWVLYSDTSVDFRRKLARALAQFGGMQVVRITPRQGNADAGRNVGDWPFNVSFAVRAGLRRWRP